MSIVSKITFIYYNRLTGKILNVPRLGGHLSHNPLDPLFIKNSPTTIIFPCEAMSSTGGEISSTLTGGIQEACSDSTSARHRAMFGPNELCAHTRLSLCSISAYVYLRKSRGGHRGMQDFNCLLLIQGYLRSKGT